jgi:hypothetical protein
MNPPHATKCSEHLTTTRNTARKRKRATGRGNTAQYEDNERRNDN